MNGEHDMAALNDWLDKIRNTFTEAASLLQTVRTLRNELDGLKRDLDNVRNVNRTLEENLSWSRQERERLEQVVTSQNVTINSQANDLQHALADNESLRRGASEDDRTIRQLRDQVAMLSFEREEYEKEVAELRQFKQGVEKSLAAIAPKSAAPQPRDPVTGHWKSPQEIADDKAKEAATQDGLQEQPHPMTGTDPYTY